MKKAVWIVLVFSLVSCKGYYTDFILRDLGVYDEEINPIVYSNDEKDVVLLGMHHIGKRSFYDDVKFKVDSLRDLGFHFLYESVMYESDFPKKQQQIYDMKYRKLTGFHLGKNGYLDTVTNTIAGKVKVNKKHKLVNQPRYTKLGLDLLVDEKADFPLNILIDKYETEFGVIELDECDYKTKLEEVYKCTVWTRGVKDYVIKDVRNEEIVNKILSSNNNKIAVIYGKAHFEGVVKILQEKDSAWVKVRVD